jgi:hypothetical protein
MTAPRKTRRPTGMPSWPILLIAGSEKAGKAQPLDARIATPTGWTTMGQIKVGDRVIGSDGLPTRVTQVHERGRLQIYRLAFSDGATVDACDEHLWATWTSSERHARTKAGARRHLPAQIRDTETLRQMVLDGVIVHIPMAAPVQYDPATSLPLDPYLLGLLLGDGGLSKPSWPTFTSGDPEQFVTLSAALPDGDSLSQTPNPMTVGIKGGATAAILRRLGLIGIKSSEKFIPAAYLTASVSDRLALLQGLMDTDGGIEKATATFCTVSPMLADGVRQIVESLGGTARARVKTTSYTAPDGRRVECKDAHVLRVRLVAETCPFRLTRKVEQWRDSRPEFSCPPIRTVREVTYIGLMPARCITVDAEDHLYLADHFIVTHNSWACAEASGSDLIGRTLWIGIGEDDPDEYANVPGADFEIVEHDGSYRDILAAIDWAVAEPATNGKPNLIVVDSMTRLWDLVCEMAQDVAAKRAERKRSNSRQPVGDDEVQITMDLWNQAKDRWGHVTDSLRTHQGPTLLTARLEEVTVMVNGKPSGERTLKVKAEKGLPYDVGGIVQLPERGKAYLTGVRTTRMQVPERVPLPGFTVDRLWRQLGLAELEIGERHHSAIQVTPNATVQHIANAEVEQARKAVYDGAKAAGLTFDALNLQWKGDHAGQDIREAEDIGALELLADGLRARVEAKAS